MAKLGLDGSGFQQGLQRAGGQMQKFAGTLKSTMIGTLAGAFGTAALGSMVRGVTQYAGALSDMSKKLEVSKTFLQEMEFAGRESGATLETVGAALRGLKDARSDALAGNAEKLNAFKAFGLDEAAIKGASVEQLFRRISSVVQTIDFGEDELPLIEKTLSKAGSDLLPMMKAGFDAAAASAHDLGAIISDEVTDALDEAGDAADRLSARLRRPVAEMTARLASFGSEVLSGADRYFGGLGAHIGGMIGTPGGLATRWRGGVAAEQAHLADMAAQDAATAAPAREKGNRAPGGAGGFAAAATEATKALTLRERLFDMSLKLMDTDEKRAAILQRIADIESKAKNLIGPERESDRLARLAELADLRTQLLDDAPAHGKGSPLNLQLGRFEQQGAWSGMTAQRALALSGGGRSDDSPRRTTKAVEESKELLRQILREVRADGGKSFF